LVANPQGHAKMLVPKSEILLLEDIENDKAAMNIEQWLLVNNRGKKALCSNQ
jgi:hypothetical protein